MSYWRFAAMIGTSTVVMFGLMYLNTYTWSHIFYSETRTYMAILMGAVMAVIMLSFMWSMYSNKVLNIGIYVASVLVFAVSLWLVRSQATVDGVSYMRAMIPHHSIAIMTSERANISDPRVRKLADEIIAAQQKEISEMRYLIADLTGEDLPERPETLEEKPADVAPISEAISSAVLRTLDLADMKKEEVEKVLGEPATCEFRRTAESGPILAATDTGGVLKISGQLVEVGETEVTTREGVGFSADGIDLLVAPTPGANTEDGTGEVDADLTFALEEGLTVGYRGYWSCAG
jgi:hypothetical protein